MLVACHIEIIEIEFTVKLSQDLIWFYLKCISEEAEVLYPVDPLGKGAQSYQKTTKKLNEKDKLIIDYRIRHITLSSIFPK